MDNMNNANPVNVSSPESQVVIRRPRGFAAMDPERVREISSKGGKAAHALGRAHQFNSDEARAAGKKGGVAPHKSRGRRPKSVKV